MAEINAFNTITRKGPPQRTGKYMLDGNGIGQQLHGNIRVGNKGTGNVLIDGTNNRIIIHDGTTNRIVIGNV